MVLNFIIQENILFFFQSLVIYQNPLRFKVWRLEWEMQDYLMNRYPDNFNEGRPGLKPRRRLWKCKDGDNNEKFLEVE